MNSIGLALQTLPATGSARMMGNLLGGSGSAALRGLGKDMRFGDMLSKKLDTATDGTDAATQLAALLMGGMPVADVTNQIATSITNGVARALDGHLPAKMKDELQRALAAALAPPGTSPPQTLAQQAQTLVQRLRSTIEAVARETKTDAGQQSRFSGDILDAVSTAKDTPAQQTNDTSSTIDSIVADVLAQLRTAADASSSSPTSQPGQPQTQSAQAKATDIVGRMIARAMIVDARREDAAPAVVAAAAATPAFASGKPPTLTPSAVLFQRLVAIVTQAAQTQTASGNANSSGNGTNLSQQHADLSASSLLQPAATDASAAAFAAQPFAQSMQPLTTAATTQAIDAQALIDQIVKGFTVRTFGSTSEVRMRLHPDQLGDVSLKLTITGGTINASIVAQNADVQRTLMANVHQLAQSLADAGLSLGNFSVDVSGGQGGRSNEQQAQLGKKSPARIGLSTESDDDNVEPSRFGPSILNRPQDPWLLNYFA